MDNETTTFGLDPDQLMELMKIGSETEPDAPDRNTVEKYEFLCERLAEPLPVDIEKTQTLPPVIGYLSPHLKSIAGESLQNLIQNPKTEIEIIKNIKSTFKHISTTSASEVEQECAAVLYHSAVAHALVFHQRNISKYPYAKLKNSFLILAPKSWITEDLAQLFQKAAAECQKNEV